MGDLDDDGDLDLLIADTGSSGEVPRVWRSGGASTIVAPMRSMLGLFVLLCVLGCGKAHRPSKGFVAGEMNCKRGGLTLSEVFEDTWTGEDGAMRLRYRVGASCTKPKNGPVAPVDVWQECRWSGGDWDCAGWQTGTPGGSDTPAGKYLNVEERGR